MGISAPPEVSYAIHIMPSLQCCLEPYIALFSLRVSTSHLSPGARCQHVLKWVFTEYECPDRLWASLIDTARAMCALLRRRGDIEYVCIEADDIQVKPSDFLAGVRMCEVVSYALQVEQAAVYDGFPFGCMDLFRIQHKKRKRRQRCYEEGS